MGAGLDAISYCTGPDIAILVAYPVFFVCGLAAVAGAKLARTESEAKVSVPSIAASLSVLVGLEVFLVRWAATTVTAAFGE
jgi:hypothetical protein